MQTQVAQAKTSPAPEAARLSFAGPYGIEVFRPSDETFRINDPKWATDPSLNQFSGVDLKIAVPEIGWKLEGQHVCVFVASLPRSPSVLNDLAIVEKGKLEKVG